MRCLAPRSTERGAAAGCDDQLPTVMASASLRLGHGGAVNVPCCAVTWAPQSAWLAVAVLMSAGAMLGPWTPARPVAGS